MQNEAKQEDQLSPLVQDVMKHMLSAIRAIKLYPPNNPIYSQSIKKSYTILTQYLETFPDFRVGIQKNWLTFEEAPFGRDNQIYTSLVQDLFAKGIREINFTAGVAEGELVDLYQALALSPEEIAIKSGVPAILWEKGATHITVTEAGLEDVVAVDDKVRGHEKTAKAEPITGRTLVLGDAKTNPEGFAASLLEFAKKTRAPHESTEDRLFSLYQQAGRKINKDHPEDSEALFEGLAKSILTLEPLYRRALIGGKLYGALDAEVDPEAGEIIPGDIHELQAGRLPDYCTTDQVATLLKKAALEDIVSAVPPPDPQKIPVIPLPDDLDQIARSLEETPEYMSALKTISEAGLESHIIEAAVRSLTSLMPLVKTAPKGAPTEKENDLFSAVVLQLEDLLTYLLSKKIYGLAAVIVKALLMPVDPGFAPRMSAALKKSVSTPGIREAVADMRSMTGGTPEYKAVYEYLAALDRKAVEVLLGLLNEERDRAVRLFLLGLLKDLGKNHVELFAEHLKDDRWYVVRNMVILLAECPAEQALFLLRKVVDHRNIKIRQEVLRALVSIGGKKAAGMLIKFLQDEDPDVRLTAANALAAFREAGSEEAGQVMEFLKERRIKKKDRDLTLAGIRALGIIGGSNASSFLRRYTKIRWWKSRSLQREFREAALRSIEEITRREDNGRAAR